MVNEAHSCIRWHNYMCVVYTGWAIVIVLYKVYDLYSSEYNDCIDGCTLLLLHQVVWCSLWSACKVLVQMRTCVAIELQSLRWIPVAKHLKLCSSSSHKREQCVPCASGTTSPEADCSMWLLSSYCCTLYIYTHTHAHVCQNAIYHGVICVKGWLI